MLLTIATTHEPATDLGYLLHKHPERTQTFNLSFGAAHVFYPEASKRRCTVALLLDVDPVGLVRGKKGAYASIANYVNDRPYVVSSFTSVAIAKVFGSALSGRSSERPDLCEQALPFETRLSAVPARGGHELLERLFAPLGYEVKSKRYPLDPDFEVWGESRFHTVDLSGEVRLADLLKHLYVLLPVLDEAKHYYVGRDEVDKLLAKGEGWLADHPEKDEIAHRYLNRRRGLARAALAQLMAADGAEDEAHTADGDSEDDEAEKAIPLHEQRLGAVIAALRAVGARRVLDLGCGEGRLLRLLLKERSFDEILGMDVSSRALTIAERRLRLDRLPPLQRARIRLIQGSLLYRDARLSGYDAAAAVEVIEHLDPPRLRAFERSVFEFACPGRVVITTPNREYNVLFDTLPEGALRHRDHRFEWTREEFETWGNRVADEFGYAVRFLPIGPEDAQFGAPSQMAVLDRTDRSE